ncbi:SGNH/GDSL hydrolase family protein [bacterium]|nr:SGNH/GDSL hydrolase family protein [bacterium]
MGRRRLYVRLAISTITSVAVLCAAEVWLRITSRAERDKAQRSSIWQGSQDSTLIYVHRSHYRVNDRVVTEAHGLLQANDASEKKLPKTSRILLIGDSVAAMPELPEAARLSGQLEALLDGGGRPVQILNFAVNGYKTTQEARLLETVASPFEADMILVQYCLNDPGNSSQPTLWFLETTPPCSYLWDFGATRLGIGRKPSTADPRYSQYVPIWGPQESSADYWLSLYANGSESWASVEEGFGRIGAAARARGIPVVLAIFPLFLEPNWRTNYVRPFHNQVRASAEAAGFTVVDLLEPLSTHPVTELRKEAGDIYHASPLGLSLAAQELTKSLKELLPGPPASNR